MGGGVMDAKHTSGPWTVEEYGDDEAPSLVIHNGSETRVCFMATPGSHGDPARIEANARLIAAAPELYEALRLMVEINGGLGASAATKRAQAALAKAEGRS